MEPPTAAPWENPFPVPTRAFDAQIVAVLGAQWGDEGKGKLVDVLAATADICCRFNGGANAGHTLVVNGTRFPLHLVPCGVLYPHTMNLLGSGVVIHLKTLLAELQLLENHYPDASRRVLLSSRAQLLFDFHQAIDSCQESEKSVSGNSIGTTKRGIGPCYASKMDRTGLRVHDLLDWSTFEEKYNRLLAASHRRYVFDFDGTEELERHRRYAEIFRPYIVDGVAWLHEQLKAKKRILAEGANGTFLDIDFGTYPCVTSSSTTTGGVCTGLGVPPSLVRQVILVVKAYTTRVGQGPFITELKDCETGLALQARGREFGTTTGRPRRCGWLDTCMVRFSCAICGACAINLTKLDVLTGLSTIKIAVAYRNTQTGELLGPVRVPESLEAFEPYEPVYETLPGWTEDLSTIKQFADLPQAAQAYVRRVEELVERPVVWVRAMIGGLTFKFVLGHHSWFTVLTIVGAFLSGRDRAGP